MVPIPRFFMIKKLLETFRNFKGSIEAISNMHVLTTTNASGRCYSLSSVFVQDLKC
jgi:hypothetical protein